MKRDTRRGAKREERLRLLAAWYEWGDDLESSEALQAAADAVREKAIDECAADALIAAWQPFAGVEAQTRTSKASEDQAPEPTVEQGVIAQMRTLVEAEKNPARRVRLADLLREQLANFRRAR